MAGADDTATPAASAYCSWCGASAPGGVPMTWSVQTSERGVQTLCEACTRINVRSIEAKLDAEWW